VRCYLRRPLIYIWVSCIAEVLKNRYEKQFNSSVCVWHRHFWNQNYVRYEDNTKSPTTGYKPWNVMGKCGPIIGRDGPGGKKYSSTLSLTSALDGGAWSTSSPCRYTLEKDIWYPLYRRPGGPQGLPWRVRKISSARGFDPRAIQPVASRYTNYAIPAHRYKPYTGLFLLHE